ncbi:YtxH domain-containing protein [Pseudoneobacillus sp. C159]
MGNTNKFWTGVIAGAVAGGLISLLDRETRQTVGEKTGKAVKNISYVITHPKEIATNIKEKTIALKETALQMSEDISFIAQKIDEVRELTPEVTGLVKDTKEAFFKDKENIEEL